MAGENLTRYQPVQEGIEPQLPASEVGERAHQLIADFQHALKTTPEFLQELGDKYFTQKSLYGDSRFGNVDFIKGGTHYRVRYEKIYNEEIDKGREELYIQRTPLNPKSEHEWWSDTISLKTYTSENGVQFEDGVIRAVRTGEKFDKEPDIPNNTQNAIQRVQEFLTRFSER